MFFLTGSATGARYFLRQPHFFEPMALSLGATIATMLIPAWSLTSLLRPLGIAILLLGWGWLRLRPLASFVVDAPPRLLARRPLLTMLIGAGAVFLLAVVAAIVPWDGWRAGGLGPVLLVAAFGGLPLGAAFWEDRFGRKARHARRRAWRTSRSVQVRP
jgi:hypothetical protein